MRAGTEAEARQLQATLAEIFNVHPERLGSQVQMDTPSHRLGLWNCQNEDFYLYVFHKVRPIEGMNWLTNSRTPAQILAWRQSQQAP